MATFSGEPLWMQAAKRDVQSGKEWIEFTKMLFDLVNVEMKELGVSSFSVLNTDEKKKLVSKAIFSMKNKSLYSKIFNILSRSLDYHFSSQIKQQSSKVKPNFTLSDKILDELHNCVETIVARWPDTRVHFVRCVNTSLSPRLRHSIWCAQLQNPSVKRDYLHLAKTAPKRMVSKQDLEIAQKCQIVLESNSTLSSFSEINGSISVLRHVLSYHHVLMKTENQLPDTDFLLAVPFVYCTLSSFRSQKTENQKTVSAEALASVVEQFLLFLADRPEYTRNTDNGKSLVKFSTKVLAVLQKIDENLPKDLNNLYSKSFHKHEDETVNAVSTILAPCLRCYFVTYLPLECVMFILDQIFLGRLIEDYDPLPLLTAVLLFLCLKELNEVSSWQQLQANFRESLKQLSVERIQDTMSDKSLTDELQEIVNGSYPSYTASLATPTVLSSLPSWKHWNSEKLVEHFELQLKKKSRVSRSSAYFEENNDPVGQVKGSIVDLEIERDNLIKEIELVSLELQNSRKTLAEERLAKIEVEKQADFEIDQLKQKIAYLEKSDRLTPPALLTSAASRFGLTEPEYEDSDLCTPSVPPPPPTGSPFLDIITKPSSVVTPEPEVENQDPIVEVDALPQETITPMVERPLVIHDVVVGMMQSVHSLLHGAGQERLKLDMQTKLDLAATKKVYEQVKTKVLGKATTEEELRKLSPEEYQKVSLKISGAMKTRLMKLKTKY